MPPPPPPPLGLNTLGPEDFRAIGAMRGLRRLSLDVSLRSSALAVASVQALGALSHLEARCTRCSSVLGRPAQGLTPSEIALVRRKQSSACRCAVPYLTGWR